MVYTHKLSTVNNVASKKKTFITNLCGSIYIERSFSLRCLKIHRLLVSLFVSKLRFDLQLFILFKYKNPLKIDETMSANITPQKTGLKLVGV